MKKLFAIVALCLFVLGACTEPSTPGVPSVNITSENPLEIPAEAGMYRIDYTLANENSQLALVPTCEASWISNLAVTSACITFRAEENVDLLQDRVAEVSITYGTEVKTVTIKQQKKDIKVDVEFEAKVLSGEYEHHKKEGYNYFAILSEKGTTGWYDLYVDTYFRIDMFSDIAPATEGPITLPVGTYYYDEFSMGKPGTFAADMSARLQPHEDGTYTENFFSGGVIVVTETGIEAILILDDGKVHHVTYTGSTELKYLEVPEPDFYTSLTEDYIFELNGMSQVYYYGDIEGVGLGNWLITTANSYDAAMNGEYFCIDIYVDSLEFNTDNVYGEYTAVAAISELKAGNFLGGVYGSWMNFVEDGYLLGTGAPLTTGTVKFEKSGLGAILTVDCVDDLGHKVSGTVNCNTVEFYDFRE